MEMYEKLIQALRCCADDNIPCAKCPRQAKCIDVRSMNGLFPEAADALEELLKERDAAYLVGHQLADKLPVWIPVTERLPEENGKYLCNIKRFGQYAGKQYYYVDVLVFQEDCFFEDGIGTERVTHWMPLPELPDHIGDANEMVEKKDEP